MNAEIASFIANFVPGCLCFVGFMLVVMAALWIKGHSRGSSIHIEYPHTPNNFPPHF